jgi:hypothetical protein
MTYFSWRWNSKFWGYLRRTSDGSQPEPHKIRLRNIKISPFSILSSEKSILRKRVFSQRKSQKMTNFFKTSEFKFLSLFIKNDWWLISRNTQNTTSKHKNFTIFSLILREFDAEKTRSQPAKTQKMTNFFMMLEFKILRLLMNNKWRLTSRTTQNTTSKHKNFTIFSHILREMDAEKSRFQPAKTQKITNFFKTLEFKILKLFTKNKWWLTPRTTQNTTSEHKSFTFFSLIHREIDAEKTRFQPAKSQKMTNFSWRLN